MKSVHIRQISNGFIVTTNTGGPPTGAVAEQFVSAEDLASFLATFFANDPA